MKKEVMKVLTSAPPVLAQFYYCMFSTRNEHERVQDFLLRAALNGSTENIRYRLWTLETGVLCLAIPLNQSTPRYSPEHRLVACFCPVAPEAVDWEVLLCVQKHAERIRDLARIHGIVLPDEALLHVSEQPGEDILSLKCESDAPAWDQSVRLVCKLKDIDWAWQGYPLNGNQIDDPLIYPKFAWKNVTPSRPSLLMLSQSPQVDCVMQQEGEP